MDLNNAWQRALSGIHSDQTKTSRLFPVIQAGSVLQVGHEVAHAVARHSSEKLSLGIFLTVASQLAIQAFQIYARRNQEGGQGRGGGVQGVSWYSP